MAEAVPDQALDALRTLADRLTRTVSVARALTDAGRIVDLAGLQDGIGLLCAKTLDMHASESRTMLPAILELRAQLDSLAARMAGSAGRVPQGAPAAAPLRARH